MNKLIMLALSAAIAVPLFAQEEEKKEEAKPVTKLEDRKRESAMWPACFAVCKFPASPDVVGLRLTIPFSDYQDSVTGLDLGLWGRSTYFEGIQLNVIRNDVKDRAAGFQVGLYNSIGSGEMLGLQVGLWNEANAVRGLQCGLVNLAGEAQGLQVGLINRCETMYGYQVGLINVIRDAELQFFPIVNIGF